MSEGPGKSGVAYPACNSHTKGSGTYTSQPTIRTNPNQGDKSRDEYFAQLREPTPLVGVPWVGYVPVVSRRHLF